METALKTGMINQITKDMTEEELKQSTREVLDYLDDFVLVYDGMFCRVADDIDRIADCGDYMKLRIAEKCILEEAARRYVLPNDHGLKLKRKK